MKKFLPTITLVAIMFVGYKLMSSGSFSPIAMIMLSAVGLLSFASMRPKKPASAVTPEAISDLLGDYANDVFNDESKLSKEFHAAVSQFLANMPKATITKMTKLLPQCRNNQERYAVSIIRGQAYFADKKFKEAIQDFNQAVVLNPSSELAIKIGSCQQRIGELWKAIDSYEFALDLDPKCVAARSALATAWVANRNYEKALNEAELVLELEETNASALATAAICHGLLGNIEQCDSYISLAEENGYSRQKIVDTIKALKK